MEAYRQLYHSNENLMTDLLETIESELNDNSLNKELKRITNKLRTLLKKEENLVNLKLEGKISDTIYNEKYNEISSEKVFLAEEKVNIETTLKSEIDVKKRLTEFKHLLSSQKILTVFDRTVFESIVEKIIVGGVNSDGEIDPAMLTKYSKQVKLKTRMEKNLKVNVKMLNQKQINCVLKTVTRIKNCILKEQTTHVETVTVLERKKENKEEITVN